jgi:hypothetical protein
MVKNWSKIVLVSLLVIAVAAPVFATTARVRALANTGDYLSDDSNVFRWYSTLPSYANMVQAEMGTWEGFSSPGFGPAQADFGPLMDSRALGFNYACGEDGKWGTYRLTLNENSVDHPGFYLVNPFIMGLSPGSAADDVPDPYDTTPVNKWDLAGGWEIGETIVLGLAYTRSSMSYEYSDAETTTDDMKLTSSWSTYGLGFTWTNNEDLILDATFTFASAGGKWENADTSLSFPGNGVGDAETVEWDKSTGIELSARLFWDWKDYVTVVPVFQYAQAEYAMKRSPTGYSPPNGDKSMGIVIGVALDIEVNGSNTLIWATEYNYGKWEPSTNVADFALESTFSVFPTFRLALESEITSWLTTRVGAVHSNIAYTDKGGDIEEKVTDGAFIPGEGWIVNGFTWHLGAGFNVAEWTIDAELAPETPFSLGYWVTGYSAFGAFGGPGPVYRLSGTYNF